MDNLTNIWREVQEWPPEQRLALATRILQSLQHEGQSATVSDKRGDALRELIGIWKTAQPPNDEEVEQIVEQERLKKAKIEPPPLVKYAGMFENHPLFDEWRAEMAKYRRKADADQEAP